MSLAAIGFCCVAAAQPAPPPPSPVKEVTPPKARPATPISAKTRVLVVTGGHGFEEEPFFQMFKDNSDIVFKAVEHPNAHALLTPARARGFDVIVLYDMHQEITPAAKDDFLACLKEGKGLVVLHHAIANYQSWPDYRKIIGARYYLQPTVVDGVEKARSAYKHDMEFKVHIADPEHPVTKGVADFRIRDETYKGFDVAKDVHPLLTTEEPESNDLIGWARTEGNARIVFIQLGHDHFAYESPHYRQILRQAIQWTARKS
jgi:hypothetical protein